MEYLVVSLMFIVFLQTRFVELRRATLCLALQSALIAAACLVVGMSHGSGLHAWLPGMLTIAVKVLFIPYAILRVVNQLRDEREIVSDINVNYSTAFAACSLALGYMVIDGLLPQAEGRYFSDLYVYDYDRSGADCYAQPCHYADDRPDYLGKRHLPARSDYDRRLAADYRAGYFPGCADCCCYSCYFNLASASVV